MRDEGLPQPRALVLFSPALDLSGSGPDKPTLERRDPALSLKMLREIGPIWLRALSSYDTRVSPLFGTQAGLPPSILFTAHSELLHSDALRLLTLNSAVFNQSYTEMTTVFPAWPLPH